MDIHNVEPTALTPDQAIGLATDYTNSHAAVVDNIKHLMQSAATDATIDNEDILATIYKPVVKVATKNAANNETRLGELCDLLIQAAHSQMVTNHGSLVNLQKELARELGYDDSRAGGVVSSLVGHNEATKPSPTTIDGTDIIPIAREGGGIGSGGIGNSGGTIANLPLDIVPITGTNQGGSSIPPSVEGQGTTPITKILGIPQPLPEPSPSGNINWGDVINPVCPDYQVDLRPVTLPDGIKACLGSDGNIYAEYCCRPSPIPPPPSCIDETTTGGGGPPPTPGGNENCPKPTLPCPEGLEWQWNEQTQQWQCKPPLPKPEPKPQAGTCQDYWDKINLNVNLTCDDLPQEVRDKLEECGFAPCKIDGIDCGGAKVEVASSYGSLFAMFDEYNGIVRTTLG